MQARAEVGKLGVRDRVDDPEKGEHEGADHQHGELGDAIALGGARIERDGKSDDDDERSDASRTLRNGSVPSHRSPLVRTTAMAAHDSPIMKSARPNVDSAPISQSSVQSTLRPAPITRGRLTPPGVGELRAGGPAAGASQTWSRQAGDR